MKIKLFLVIDIVFNIVSYKRMVIKKTNRWFNTFRYSNITQTHRSNSNRTVTEVGLTISIIILKKH